jgi:hypothetical protein
MKIDFMFDTDQICPYTGLRSFSEEESLYFKGREDDIDQASNQLQRNKFLMLTGASGDGKSSLIYAGIIPNARAGFLKSKYSHWCVADFRPERSPFQNLCKSIARELDILNPAIVQSELNHGFSALVDLYKNSKRFLETNTVLWQNADNKAKSLMKQDAANLIILVDQFEEFFTNPENYLHGVPSKDASLVVNILLETARIALEEDLPIYVIFTMRSDYIGQCAAFRGLPEYIGFSQFFVPHLNRAQLQQVIEEPAVLSGNRITRRLTERLIHDLTEGVDQLPILQHALNQIWVAANQGHEDMDLIHYAMVGGMSSEDLPTDQIERFEIWFGALQPEIKACYHAPGLQNVLDTHTNKLYANAARYYVEKTGKPISAEAAKSVIRTTFTCLTKIDQGRAVRNRMTLYEITRILNIPEFDEQFVGAVINTFREPGNTFIRPFISQEKPETMVIQSDQVLDITHESLIRNWQFLDQWAKEEFDSRSVYVDFEQQLKRWVKSRKSGSFLLPIGPLTFFENWYQKARPNEWWIARYMPEGSLSDVKLTNARETLSDAQEFLAKSGRKYLITRTLIRYGSKRLAITLGALILITLTSFVVKSYFDKQNAKVLNDIHRETMKLANNSTVTLDNSAALICEELKIGTTSVDEVVQSINDPVRRINVVNGIGALLIFQGNDNPVGEMHRSLFVSDSLLESLTIPLDDPVRLSKALNEIIDFRSNLELANYYRPDTLINSLRKRNAIRCAIWVKKILDVQPAGFTDIQNLNTALEYALNLHEFLVTDIKHLLQVLSPFENGLKTNWLQSAYDRDKFLARGRLNYGFKFNGLYQELAYLYAAVGNSSKVLQCIDTLFLYNQNYFQGDYEADPDNASNIASVFYTNGMQNAIDLFVSGYCQRRKINADEFYARVIGRKLPSFSAASNIDLYWWSGIRQNLNVQFMSRTQMQFFFSKYRESVRALPGDSSQRNYLTALSYKNEAILMSINKEAPAPNEPTVDRLFGEALSYYKKIGQSFKESQETFAGASSGDEMKVQRKFLFLYPDIRLPFFPKEPRMYFYYYFSDAFIEYILNHNLFEEFYPGKDELKYVSDWVANYHQNHFIANVTLTKEWRYEILQRVEHEIVKNGSFREVDFNLLYLYLGRGALERGDYQSMSNYYDKIQIDKIFNNLRYKGLRGLVNDETFRLLANVVKGIAKNGHIDQAYSYIEIFKNPINRSSLYAWVSLNLQQENGSRELVKQFLDSAIAEMNRATDIKLGQPNRELIANALVMQNPTSNVAKAYGIIRNIPDKLTAIMEIGKSYGYYGKLYEANTAMPQFISHSDKASFYWYILLGYEHQLASPGEEWSNFDHNYIQFLLDNIKYLDENG